MRRKISVQLSGQVLERLEAAAERAGASKSAMVEAALERSLNIDAENIDDATLLRRLDRMRRQLERALRTVNRTIALHARYHLTVTPPLPQGPPRAAGVLGTERFEVFAAQVGRRVHLETMERLSATNRELYACDVEEGEPLVTPCADSQRDAWAPTVGCGDLEMSAGVQEEASNGNFLGEVHNPYR